MTTPEPAERHRMAPRVDHRLFILLDPRGPEDPRGTLPAYDEILSTSTSTSGTGVVFLSGGDMFRPDVTVELWPAPPGPAVDADWDEIAETEFAVPSGFLRLKSLMGGSAGPDLTVTPGRVRLRAHTRGRGEAMERLSQETGYDGVEEWLLQLWPAT
jgi:hypothetical protein